MRRPVGLAIGAVVLSVTLGVMIGLVIHTGRLERAMPPPVAPYPTGFADADPASSPPPQVTAPGLLPTSTDAASTAAPAAATTAATPSMRHPTPTIDPTIIRASDIDTATGTAAASSDDAARATTSEAPARSTASRSTESHSTSEASASTLGAPGPAQADERCRVLGDKSATAQGVTVFCQRYRGTDVLRWRPVTDGGGCLNQKMTGIGVDGRHYACRLGADKLNHWVRTDTESS